MKKKIEGTAFRSTYFILELHVIKQHLNALCFQIIMFYSAEALIHF